MVSLLDSMVDEVCHELPNLAKDISGTHVVRSLICALSGNTLIKAKSGRGKHKALVIDTSRSPSKVPVKADAIKNKIIEQFKMLPQEALHDLVCNEHAGPLMSMLVQVAFPDDAKALVEAVFSYMAGDLTAFYHLAADPVGSHCIETVRAHLLSTHYVR